MYKITQVKKLYKFIKLYPVLIVTHKLFLIIKSTTKYSKSMMISDYLGKLLSSSVKILL